MLNISWYGDVQQTNQTRFSLAYYDNGIPVVSVVTDGFNCTDFSPPTCEEVTNTTVTVTGSPHVDIIPGSTHSLGSIQSSTVTVTHVDIPGTTHSLGGTQSSSVTVTESDYITTAGLSTSQSEATVVLSDAEAKMTHIIVVISGVFSSLMLSLLLISVVICVIVLRRRRKSFPVNSADSTEMNRHVYEARPFQDTTSKAIDL